MKVKLCHRTVSAGNYEPSQCIGPQCNMYGRVGGIEGCMEATLVMFKCIGFVQGQEAKSPSKTEKVPEPPKVADNVEVTGDISKDKTEAEVDNKPEEVDNDEGKTDSRTGNILEGGDESPDEHDSNGSSSTV